MTTFMRLGPLNKERPAVELDDGTIRELASLTDDIDGAFLASGGLARAREAGPSLPLFGGARELRVGSPVARPQAVICIGQNYAAHAAESGSDAPTSPIIFFKHPNTVVGAYDDVLIPPGAATVDWEVELGVVIGRRASYLASEADALEHVAGYAVSHDVSERHAQLEISGGQWSKGKSSETFNPFGPALVPADEISNPQALHLWSTVNGEQRQSSTTADMIFSVAYLIWHLSQFMVLEPGDIINTGTPEGVALSGRFPYLAAGDVVDLGIDPLGYQRQRLVQR